MGELKVLDNGEVKFTQGKLPRYPICFFTFKEKISKKIFEVKEINSLGVQLELKDGVLAFQVGQSVEGNLHWRGEELKVSGEVMWVREFRLGIKFFTRTQLEILDFLSLDKVLKMLRRVSSKTPGIEYPLSLSTWLHCDGPVDIFLWSLPDGGWEKFQFIIFRSFLEWVDGEGLKTGSLFTRRNLKTPLFDQDEFVFQLDRDIDIQRLNTVRILVEKLDTQLLDQSTKNFIKAKIGP
jgi:hypothetical protein